MSTEPSDITIIDATNTRDLSPLALDDNGELRILPASFWAETTREERAAFGVRNGIYCFPTLELVEHLKGVIGDRTAIEVGAGSGVLGKALGIPATDNRMQEWPQVKGLYSALAQPVVAYGDHVEEMDAVQAVEHYKPDVVIAAWLTHRYSREHPERGGNIYGVDELALLRKAGEYVFIGNAHVHRGKPLWGRKPADYVEPPWVYSRAFNGTPDFVARWRL